MLIYKHKTKREFTKKAMNLQMQNQTKRINKHELVRFKKLNFTFVFLYECLYTYRFWVVNT